MFHVSVLPPPYPLRSLLYLLVIHFRFVYCLPNSISLIFHNFCISPSKQVDSPTFYSYVTLMSIVTCFIQCIAMCVPCTVLHKVWLMNITSSIHVWTNISTDLRDNPPLSTSDHMGIFGKESSTIRTKCRLIWRYSYACELINDFDWESQDIDLLWKLWHQRFMMTMTEAIPNSKIHMSRPR